VRTWVRVLLIFGLVLGLIVVGVVGYGVHLVRASFPQVDGDIGAAGISSPIEVLRDDLGIPTIYADNLEDLFFAQGFVHAQDRFWEMDVRRHITAGRLSEMFGESQIPTDTFLRTLGWQRIAEQEVSLLSDRSRRILDAYARGVNAYLDDKSGADLSLEYAVLALQNPDYLPEPWEPADSVAWLKALAWDLRGNMTDEVYRAVMSASMGVEATEELFPVYPYARNRPIVEIGAVVDGRFDQNAQSTSGSAPRAAIAVDYTAALPALASVNEGARLLADLLGPSGPGIGSNSWAVAGEKTDTGMPLLANDPHLAPAMPSLWYQASLRCWELDDDCNYDVSGWTMAGLPGVFIGHNGRIAWGFTNLGPDVTDLVLHQVMGDTYLFDGEQLPLEVRSEVIEVAGGDPVEIEIRSTRDGPIISGIEDIPIYDVIGADAPVPAPGSAGGGDRAARGDGYAVALRWTALDPQPTFDAFDALNTATDWQGFRDAARLLAVPAQNLLYADTEGRIGYQAPGRIPIREGYDGKWPIPGWTSEYSWSGFIPFEALPTVIDPPEGWIVTANQAVIGPDYGYFLTDDWAYGARSQRIVELIESATAAGAQITAERMRTIQMDSHNALADFLVPRLLGLPAPDGTAAARELLATWDFQQSADSAGAAYFNAVWAQMAERMFDAAADTELITSSGNDRFWQVIENIWDEPTNVWWDDKTTPDVEDRDALLAAAQVAAVVQLEDLLGGDPGSWRWGSLHTLTFENATLGTSGIAPIEMVFNRGPVEVSGSESAINATGWTPSNGFGVDWVPSMRQVIDVSDFDASTWVNLTGNSGHTYNRNYSDQIDTWVVGDQFPWPFTDEAVRKAARNTLTLIPLAPK
jgi:penicillin amidase